MKNFLEELSELLEKYEAEVSVDVDSRDMSTKIEINCNEGHWVIPNASWIDYEDIKELIDG